MKKIAFAVLLMFACLCANAQKYMALHMSDSVMYLPVDTIDFINFVDEIGTPTHGLMQGHEWVDLGLTSGTKWATMNVGATSPEDYGDYFAWGETSGYNDGKTTFSWSTYKWCEGSETTMTKYCTNSSYGTVDGKMEPDPEDDVAYVDWGSDWRMPTDAQQAELLDECTWTWTNINGINGCTVTGPNDNSIFLPAAGYRDVSSLSGAGGLYGCYWSRTLNSYGPYRAYGFYFHSSARDGDGDFRCRGRSVRPVRSSVE